MHRSAAKTFFAALCAISLAGALSSCSILSPEISPVAVEAETQEPSAEPTAVDTDASFRPVIATAEAGAAQRLLTAAGVNEADKDKAIEAAKQQINATIDIAYPEILVEYPDVVDQFLAIECSIPNDLTPKADEPGRALVACDTDGLRKYMLAPTEIGNSALSSAEASEVNGDYWAVQVTFSKQGSLALETVTDRLTSFPEVPSEYADPTDTDLTWLRLSSASAFKQLAIVAGSVVIAAPQVMSPITDGVIQISGSFSQESAETLAQQLGR